MRTDIVVLSFVTIAAIMTAAYMTHSKEQAVAEVQREVKQKQDLINMQDRTIKRCLESMGVQ